MYKHTQKQCIYIYIDSRSDQVPVGMYVVLPHHFLWRLYRAIGEAFFRVKILPVSATRSATL